LNTQLIADLVHATPATLAERLDVLNLLQRLLPPTTAADAWAEVAAVLTGPAQEIATQAAERSIMPAVALAELAAVL